MSSLRDLHLLYRFRIIAIPSGLGFYGKAPYRVYWQIGWVICKVVRLTDKTIETSVTMPMNPLRSPPATVSGC